MTLSVHLVAFQFHYIALVCNYCLLLWLIKYLSMSTTRCAWGSMSRRSLWDSWCLLTTVELRLTCSKPGLRQTSCWTNCQTSRFFGTHRRRHRSNPALVAMDVWHGRLRSQRYRRVSHPHRSTLHVSWTTGKQSVRHTVKSSQLHGQLDTHHKFIESNSTPARWLGSRVVSVLDSGAVGSGIKSQLRRCLVTVLGKLFTPAVPLFTKQWNW